MPSKNGLLFAIDLLLLLCGFQQKLQDINSVLQQEKQSLVVVSNRQFFQFVKTDLNDLKKTVVDIWDEGLQSIHQQGTFTIYIY